MTFMLFQCTPPACWSWGLCAGDVLSADLAALTLFLT